MSGHLFVWFNRRGDQVRILFLGPDRLRDPRQAPRARDVPPGQRARRGSLARDGRRRRAHALARGIDVSQAKRRASLDAYPRARGVVTISAGAACLSPGAAALTNAPRDERREPRFDRRCWMMSRTSRRSSSRCSKKGAGVRSSRMMLALLVDLRDRHTRRPRRGCTSFCARSMGGAARKSPTAQLEIVSRDARRFEGEARRR